MTEVMSRATSATAKNWAKVWRERVAQQFGAELL